VVVRREEETMLLLPLLSAGEHYAEERDAVAVEVVQSAEGPDPDTERETAAAGSPGRSPAVE